MVVGEPNINNIMGGIENTGTVRLHNHRKKLKQRFDIIKKLGQGTYGKVQLGINKETGQEVAIKTIKKSKIETEADLVRIRREIQIMSSVQHPNIIHIYEVFENREKMVLVMEYAAGGELYDYLSERKVLTEEEARRIFRQIATACYYCHKHKICHRDLKLENILLDEQGNAKIADFGLSNVFDDQRLLSTFCGSPLYASPEIVKGTPYQGPEVDCWSLGVLLYTLVYGAMPFDGSNFKRLVRQISQGDYFEPKKPSRASPLIRDMLTVNPRNRANIEKICTHWWVNEGYDECCLDISEELANQTPVRLDLLLSLAPPPPQLESEKLVVTGEAGDESGCKAEAAIPARSQSVGSIMEFANPAERRIKDMLTDDAKISPKRKLESTVSTDQMNLSKDGTKRKDKIIKENTIADITLRAPIQENTVLEDTTMNDSEATPLNKSLTQTLSREMDVEQTEYVDPATQGAACVEIIRDSQIKEKKERLKKNEAVSDTINNKHVEENNEKAALENIDKENSKEIIKDIKEDETEEKQKQEQSKIPAKRKSVKKKVLTDKNDNLNSKPEQTTELNKTEKKHSNLPEQKTENKAEIEESQAPSKPVERRRSRIFETAEKFQNLISANESKTSITDKPKKIVIPGVSVGGFKKEFERKASLTTPNKINLTKKASVEQEEPTDVSMKKSESPEKTVKPETTLPVQNESGAMSNKNEMDADNERRAQVKNAVNIISNALDKEGTRKSKSRPCMTRKPPVPFGTSGRSASGGITTMPSPLSPTSQDQPISIHSSPAQIVEESKSDIPEESKTSSAEITLKSATLPRRKTTKAEIKLDYPAPKPATMGFKTEMAHHVEGPPKVTTQRSEVSFPVSSPVSANIRSSSVEPESKVRPRERIIPISFEKDLLENKKDIILPQPTKSPVTKIYQNQRSNLSQRSSSLSRQSTQESDSETTTSTGEPIRKSPREYIIPIAVEGGGYVTPRAGSLEPTETTNKSKLSRIRRLNDREGSEDESPFATLHRHSSFGRDSDTEDPKRDIFRMHSLRSSRPRKTTIEHNDSFSSGEDDDDDGFEILTAENLFSTLLSRVRDLTQRLNVDGRPGFPTSRLLSSHFDHGSNFWNLHNRSDPLSRYAPIGRSTSREQSVDNSASPRNINAPWRRSASRDLATDIDSVFNNSVSPPTHTATLPRGDGNTNSENLNLTDLNLKKLKLSEEDALALSYLTPGLSRRIQKQLLAQLAPSEARKLSRTLSMRNSSDDKTVSREDRLRPESVERYGNTLPRRLSVENTYKKNDAKTNLLNKTSVIEDDSSISTKPNKSLLPVKSTSSELNQKSLKRLKSPNLVEAKPSYSMLSPDSSTSESLSTKPDDFSTCSDSSRLSKYLSLTTSRSFTRSTSENENGKSDLHYKSSSNKRSSRFLRPDFYDPPKDANYYLREKKEREMETQKILKEIRDKRKSRFRENSTSRETILGNVSKEEEDSVDTESTDNLLKNVSNNIKNLESSVQGIHDYVNVSSESEKNQTVNVPDYVNINVNGEETPVLKKPYVSKIARPKSYPTESQKDKEKQSKIKDTELAKSKPTKSKKQEKTEYSKNKFLQTIEKKFEKLRSFSNSPTSVSSEEARIKDDKKSSVEDTIKRLREQSLPRTLDHCSTESGLIKRAVSVEDLSCSDPKQLQASRKSVTKILNLFKKYEDKGTKKVEKTLKTKKGKDDTRNTKKSSKHKNGQLIQDKTDKDDNKSVGAVSVISNVLEHQSDKNNENSKPIKEKEIKVFEENCAQEGIPSVIEPETKKAERPRSLLLDRVKQFQPSYNGARSDNNLSSTTKEIKSRSSKLPITSFRRSLNLENTHIDPPKFYNNSELKTSEEVGTKIADRNNLKLDFSLLPCNTNSIPSTSSADRRLAKDGKEIPNSNTSTEDISMFLSPCEDNVSCDSWSICSDYHTQDLTSPISPNNHFYSADENESVSDRIRRKSFYTRFNEKKRPRKSTIGSYRDLDLYKDMTCRKSNYRSYNCSSLDRSSVELESPKDNKLYHGAITPEPLVKNYNRYTRSNSVLTNDDYVNMPNRYQTYRRASSVYASDSEDNNTLDDLSSAGKNRMYSYYNQPSRYSSRPISPLSGHTPTETLDSISQNSINSSPSLNNI